MDFGESVKTCFQKYFDFSGRGVRSEYWWFYLFTVIGGIVFDGIDLALLAVTGVNSIGALGLIFSLATIIPSISAACRRLHDTNRSGWWQLLPVAGAIPFGFAAGVFYFGAGFGESLSPLAIALMVIGGIIMIALVILLIVWLATDSDRGANRFGPSPKYESEADTFS